MANISESDKYLKLYEDRNSSLVSYILVTPEGVPYKTSLPRYEDAVKYTGLFFDLISYAKKVFDELKRSSSYDKNMTLRLRLTDGYEYIVTSENDYFLISIQMCKQIEDTSNNKQQL